MNIRHGHDARGFALASALWLIVLMTLMATALSWSSIQSTKSVAAIVGGVQARYLAEGSFQLVYANLLERDPALRLLGDGEIIEFELPGGRALLQVSDENGKIDINAAKQPLLTRLLYSLDVERARADAIASAILDYRDSNHLHLLNGAEDDDYRLAGLAWEAKDAPFTSISELRQVFGMDDELYAAMRPHVTIYSRQQGVNPEVSSLAVLVAVSDEPIASLQRYIEQRRERHADGVALPRAPVIDRRFLSRSRGITYNLMAIGLTDRGQHQGVSTAIRMRRGRNSASIQTLDWLPHLRTDLEQGALMERFEYMRESSE